MGGKDAKMIANEKYEEVNGIWMRYEISCLNELRRF